MKSHLDGPVVNILNSSFGSYHVLTKLLYCTDQLLKWTLVYIQFVNSVYGLSSYNKTLILL